MLDVHFFLAYMLTAYVSIVSIVGSHKAVVRQFGRRSAACMKADKLLNAFGGIFIAGFISWFVAWYLSGGPIPIWVSALLAGIVSLLLIGIAIYMRGEIARQKASLRVEHVRTFG